MALVVRVRVLSLDELERIHLLCREVVAKHDRIPRAQLLTQLAVGQIRVHRLGCWYSARERPGLCDWEARWDRHRGKFARWRESPDPWPAVSAPRAEGSGRCRSHSHGSCLETR